MRFRVEIAYKVWKIMKEEKSSEFRFRKMNRSLSGSEDLQGGLVEGAIFVKSCRYEMA